MERLSQTTYVAVDDTSKRRYERVLSNLLPYRATKAKTNADANFSLQYSDSFVEDEFLAVRDEPGGPFYLARVTFVTDKYITVHYYGCTEIALASAVFKPCWHEVGGDQMILDFDCPENEDKHPQFVDYNGTLQFKDLYTVLVACKRASWSSLKLTNFDIVLCAPLLQSVISYSDMLNNYSISANDMSFNTD